MGETGVAAPRALTQDMGKDIGRIAIVTKSPFLTGSLGMVTVICPRRAFGAGRINLARVEPRACIPAIWLQ